MKRFTSRDEYGNAEINGVDMQSLDIDFEELNHLTNALNRLADYEETGLTPQEVSVLFKSQQNLIKENILLRDKIKSRWIVSKEGLHFECSVCRASFSVEEDDGDFFKYCPKCGANNRR